MSNNESGVNLNACAYTMVQRKLQKLTAKIHLPNQHCQFPRNQGVFSIELIYSCFSHCHVPTSSIAPLPTTCI